MTKEITKEKAVKIKFIQSIIIFIFINQVLSIALFPVTIVISIVIVLIFENLSFVNELMYVVTIMIVCCICYYKYSFGFINYFIYSNQKERYGFSSKAKDLKIQNIIRQYNIKLTFKNTMKAFEKREFDLAFYIFNHLGSCGDVQGQVSLAMMYKNGYGVEQDYNEALKYYRMAANKGSAMAQFNIADMYENGIGVVQNYSEAARWYKIAAQNGNSRAQYNLGLFYEIGLGVKEDFDEAMNYFKLSYEHGYKEALQNYIYLETQLNLLKNQKKSLFPEAMKVFNKKSYNEAFEFFKTLAKQEDEKAQNMLAKMYENGLGCNQDYKEAIKYYHLATGNGSSAAQANLHKLYIKLEADLNPTLQSALNAFESKDYALAIKIFQNLVKNGEQKSFYYLGKIYEDGLGTQKNAGESLKYYVLGVKSGDKKAALALEQKYLDNQNYQNAIKCFTIAAKQNSAVALRHLGFIYYMGLGVEVNRSKAEQLLKQAAKLGDNEAKNFVATYLSAKN